LEVVKLNDAIRKPSARKRVVSEMRAGSILVYPTDTLYGLGCNADVPSSVEKIRSAKGSGASKHYSVIAPGKEWIWKNTDIAKVSREFADTILPGPYTIVVKAGPGAPKPVVSKDKTVGIRIPKHPISEIIEEAGIALVSTSVNITSGEPVKSLKDVPEQILRITDLAIDAGEIPGSASRVFDLRDGDVKILRY
jgi:tRNA threonylcarbamoyl adenosine modification protein (Sua5/YciO/YrdC/YwlC family)